MSDQNQNRPIIIKKIIKKAGGHHGGSWKVAYADFVTALMAFFLLMWLVTALSQQQKKGVAQYVQSYKVGQGKGEGKGSGGKPSGPIDGKGEGIFDEKGISILEGEGIGAGGEGSGMSAESVQEMLLSNIQERLSELKDQILVSLSKGNVRIEIVDKDERSIFPSGSSEPSPETVKMLNSGVPGYPWFYQMFPTGTEQQLGAILQGYCAGITDRAATLDAMDAAYAKIAKAAQ